MFTLTPDLWQVALRTAIVYVLVLAGLRVAGKREMGELASFDFVMILLLANAVQNAMTGPNTTVMGGIVAAATLLVINYGVSALVHRYPRLRRIILGQRTTLIEQGIPQLDTLEREHIDEEEIMTAAREHDIQKLSDIRTAWLEVDGNITFQTMNGRHMRVSRKKKVRYLKNQ
ncbi:MAG TPA: YetF domain-containing protein [Clostridia bacterium]|nr:YetF domain-containing protein [Clostridia bacterium]